MSCDCFVIVRSKAEEWSDKVDRYEWRRNTKFNYRCTYSSSRLRPLTELSSNVCAAWLWSVTRTMFSVCVSRLHSTLRLLTTAHLTSVIGCSRCCVLFWLTSSVVIRANVIIRHFLHKAATYSLLCRRVSILMHHWTIEHVQHNVMSLSVCKDQSLVVALTEYSWGSGDWLIGWMGHFIYTISQDLQTIWISNCACQKHIVGDHLIFSNSSVLFSDKYEKFDLFHICEFSCFASYNPAAMLRTRVTTVVILVVSNMTVLTVVQAWTSSTPTVVFDSDLICCSVSDVYDDCVRSTIPWVPLPCLLSAVFIIVMYA